jgi:hypothetical protein
MESGSTVLFIKPYSLEFSIAPSELQTQSSPLLSSPLLGFYSLPIFRVPIYSHKLKINFIRSEHTMAKAEASVEVFFDAQDGEVLRARIIDNGEVVSRSLGDVSSSNSSRNRFTRSLRVGFRPSFFSPLPRKYLGID